MVIHKRKRNEREELFQLAADVGVMVPLTNSEKWRILFPMALSVEDDFNWRAMVGIYLRPIISTMSLCALALSGLPVVLICLLGCIVAFVTWNYFTSRMQGSLMKMSCKAYLHADGALPFSEDLIMQKLYEIKEPLQRIQIAQAIIPLHRQRAKLQKESHRIQQLIEVWGEIEPTREIQRLKDLHVRMQAQIQTYTEHMYHALPRVRELHHRALAQAVADEITAIMHGDISDDVLYSMALVDTLAQERALRRQS